MEFDKFICDKCKTIMNIGDCGYYGRKDHRKPLKPNEQYVKYCHECWDKIEIERRK